MRSQNQDSFLVRLLPPYPERDGNARFRLDPATTEDDEVSSGVRIGAGGLLVLVADGMGGAPAGDLASRLAVSTVSEGMEDPEREADPESDQEEPGSAPDTSSTLGADPLSRRLGGSIQAAHDRVRSHQEDHPEHRGMGTTLTGLVLTSEAAILAQVGDSRAYRLRGDEITQLTRDQTVAQQRIEAGQLTDEQARHSPESHILLQAVGSGPNPRVAYSTDRPQAGDRYLLCSDGLTGVVEDREIARILRSSSDPREACRNLIAVANERGGPDNVTVAVVAIADG